MTGDPWSELLAAAVRVGVPILLAALGELLAERAGVVNVGVEGMMLGGAFAAFLAGYATGLPLVGLAAGIAAGLLLAAVFGLVTLRLGGDMIVAGTGLNLLALGVTGFAYQSAFGRTGRALEVARFPNLALAPLDRIPLLGPALFDQPLTAYLAYGLVAAVVVLLARTGLGLRLRAAGEDPAAAEVAGARVGLLRAGAVLGGGALAGAGGAALVLGHAGTFVEGMTAGRGFIALALVICAGWRAAALLPVTLLFGLALAFQYEIQALGWALPYQAARALPYLAAILLLALPTGRAHRAPAALGRGARG